MFLRVVWFLDKLSMWCRALPLDSLCYVLDRTVPILLLSVVDFLPFVCDGCGLVFWWVVAHLLVSDESLFIFWWVIAHRLVSHCSSFGESLFILSHNPWMNYFTHLLIVCPEDKHFFLTAPGYLLRLFYTINKVWDFANCVYCVNIILVCLLHNIDKCLSWGDGEKLSVNLSALCCVTARSTRWRRSMSAVGLSSSLQTHRPPPLTRRTAAHWQAVTGPSWCLCRVTTATPITAWCEWRRVWCKRYTLVTECCVMSVLS